MSALTEGRTLSERGTVIWVYQSLSDQLRERLIPAQSSSPDQSVCVLTSRDGEHVLMSRTAFSDDPHFVISFLKPAVCTLTFVGDVIIGVYVERWLGYDYKVC